MVISRSRSVRSAQCSDPPKVSRSFHEPGQGALRRETRLQPNDRFSLTMNDLRLAQPAGRPGNVMETIGCNQTKNARCQTWRNRLDLADQAAR